MTPKSIFDLSGKVALVTGASAGLGREISEAIAEFGADVACVARTESKVKETAKQLGRFGHRAIGIKADLNSLDRNITMCVFYY